MFRAVDAIEAESIRNTGKIFITDFERIHTKYFAKSLDDAHWYGQKLYPDGYEIIEVGVKPSFNPHKYWFDNIDIGAFAFPNKVLPNIIVK